MKLENWKYFLKENKYVFMIFTANWCGPCKRIKPIIDKKKNDKSIIQNKIKFIFIDIDENENLAIYYKVRALPTIIIFNKEKNIGKLMMENNIEKIINKYINCFTNEVTKSNVRLENVIK